MKANSSDVSAEIIQDPKGQYVDRIEASVLVLGNHARTWFSLMLSKIGLVFTPPDATGQLQPLDKYVSGVLKARAWARFDSKVILGEEDFLNMNRVVDNWVGT
jgi:hypothetical protein